MRRSRCTTAARALLLSLTMVYSRREIASWVCSLPASVLLVVCLFLPQQETCNHHVQTPLDNGSAWLLLLLALVGTLPLLWRFSPPARYPIMMITATVGAIAALSSVVLIPLVVYFWFARRWTSDEELVALWCFTATLVFLIVFPFAFLFSTDLYGGQLTWAAAFVELVGMVLWSSAARARPWNELRAQDRHISHDRRGATPSR